MPVLLFWVHVKGNSLLGVGLYDIFILDPVLNALIINNLLAVTE